ncbi:hypothetical protein BKA83DRAFT_1184512 [Pisolithus microcarpus]|nr:hypothetical protein BKA83DRAFT_1184512 [Pisolithus microcarpus]
MPMTENSVCLLGMVICYWYPSVVQEEVVRKSLLGHLRRAHLCYPPGSTCTALHSHYRHLCFPPANTCNALFPSLDQSSPWNFLANGLYQLGKPHSYSMILFAVCLTLQHWAGPSGS